MLNIDKIIDDYNENVLDDKIKEEMNKTNYYQVLDNNEDKDEEGLVITVANTQDIYSTSVQEADQTRIIKFKANDLLSQFGLPEKYIDKEVELKVIVKGRNIDNLGYPINN